MRICCVQTKFPALFLTPHLQVAEARAALAYGSPRQLPKGNRPALPAPPTFAAAGVVGTTAAQNVAAQVVSDITQPLSLAQAAVAAAAARERARFCFPSGLVICNLNSTGGHFSLAPPAASPT